MTDRIRKRGAKTLSVSVIVGTLLVPLSAAAAFWLADPGGEGDGAANAGESTTTTIWSPEATAATTVALYDDALKHGDLEEACGPAGMQLVTLEEEGSITDVQQAALDALRDICEQEGMSLPERQQPEPIVQTVVVTETASPPSTTMADDDDYYDDDRYEDEDHEDEDDDHEDDEDDDHEDEDHEYEDHEYEDHEDD